MKTTKTQTETYVLTGAECLDAITVYVTNYSPGKGKITFDCYGQAWSCYWGGMGGENLQDFFIDSHNDYILNKLLKDTRQTDFEEINRIAMTKEISLDVISDAEIAMQSSEMSEIFGDDWRMDLPTCSTEEYKYVRRIIDAIKEAFKEEKQISEKVIL